MVGRALACLILAMIKAWKFSIVFLALTPFIVASTMLTITMIKKYTIKEFRAYGSASRVAQEVLSSVRTVISLGLQKTKIKSYDKSLNDAENMAKKKGLLTGIFGGSSAGLFTFCFAIGIYYSTYLARTDCENYNVNNLMLSFFAIVTTTFSLGQALPFLKDISESRGAAKRVYAIIDRKSQIDVNERKGIKSSTLSGSIEFENVHFSYPTRESMKILNGLNLRVPAGKTVALCGSSGGGKSTIRSSTIQ